MTAPVEGQRNFNWQDVKGRRVAQVNYNTELPTYGGEIIHVNKGEWIVEAGRPDQYAKVQADEFDTDVTPDESTPADVEDVEFNPTDKTVADVHVYLSEVRAKGDEAEFNRVIAVEKDEKNRTGVVNQSF
jgi:hypothetical protein